MPRLRGRPSVGGICSLALHTLSMRPHYAFWPRRLPHALTIPAVSLWDNLATSARRYPHKPGLIYFGRRIAYGEMAETAERLAAHLHACGVRKGDRVILLMQNMPQLVMAHFAILRANAVVVPVNPMNLAEELKHYITDSDVKVAITTADLAPELAKASNALPASQQLAHLVVTQLSDYIPEGDAREPMPESWQQWLLPQRELPVLEGGQTHHWRDTMAVPTAQNPPPALEVGPDDMALLPYTSGTTGLPKGCIHLHRSIMHNAVAGTYWSMGNHEVVQLAVVPMFHVTGMISMMHCSIWMGATLVLMPRWDRDVAGRLISQYRVTNWTNIPTMVIDLLASPHYRDYDLSSLRYISGGGAAMPQAVAQRLKEEFGLSYQEGYGLTETAAPSHANPPDRCKQQCLGIPYVSTESMVVDPDTLQEVPQGETGEIVVHGPQVFQGYWRNPAATQAAFVEIGGKKFFRTGDLGRVDEEGFFFLTDRLKRMINASGFKVWPAEVEALMYRHPAIQEACIISTKDAYRGESVKAVVVLRPSHQGSVSEADIIAWCRENMAVYKVPRKVQFVDALPKSGSGKVMWRVLQEQEAAQVP